MANRFVLNETSYHGAGAIENIVPEINNRGFKKVFVATDPDLIKFGVAKKVTDLLDAAKVDYVVYSNIQANPTIENVQSGVKAFKDAGADCIVAIGGGSAMDTSKAIGIIINNPEFEDVRSLEGVAPTKKPCVTILAVPTTAGTAAEVTINYVITDVERKRKFVCVDVHDIPAVAFVDPNMMSSMPASLKAATGMDALTHAIEGFITKGAWELSDMFHIKAIEIISRSLRASVAGDKTGEEGMAREVKEETGLEATEVTYQFSYPNTYLYSGFVVHTLDMFFKVKVKDLSHVEAMDDAAAYYWIPLSEIHIEDFAFDSIRKGLKRFLATENKSA